MRLLEPGPGDGDLLLGPDAIPRLHQRLQELDQRSPQGRRQSHHLRQVVRRRHRGLEDFPAPSGVLPAPPGGRRRRGDERLLPRTHAGQRLQPARPSQRRRLAALGQPVGELEPARVGRVRGRGHRQERRDVRLGRRALGRALCRQTQAVHRDPRPQMPRLRARLQHRLRQPRRRRLPAPRRGRLRGLPRGRRQPWHADGRERARLEPLELLARLCASVLRGHLPRGRLREAHRRTAAVHHLRHGVGPGPHLELPLRAGRRAALHLPHLAGRLPLRFAGQVPHPLLGLCLGRHRPAGQARGGGARLRDRRPQGHAMVGSERLAASARRRPPAAAGQPVEPARLHPVLQPGAETRHGLEGCRSRRPVAGRRDLRPRRARLPRLGGGPRPARRPGRRRGGRRRGAAVASVERRRLRVGGRAGAGLCVDPAGRAGGGDLRPARRGGGPQVRRAEGQGGDRPQPDSGPRPALLPGLRQHRQRRRRNRAEDVPARTADRDAQRRARRSPHARPVQLAEPDRGRRRPRRPRRLRDQLGGLGRLQAGRGRLHGRVPRHLREALRL
ncbi:MAG: hypothetical protein BWZ02_02049 [Lentisphaerae bacterium ADurb.BinA184]|nr:MAG: hypothetical protein BWZ02_02049 [Lentisphaerae bacterium ADurb.BinA184]